MSDERLSLANLSRPEVRADPYPFYARLRAEDPVHYDPLTKSWLVTRYRDVMAVMHDRAMSRAQALDRIFLKLPEQAQIDATPIRSFFSQMLLYTDPPVHTRLRGLVSKAFTPKMVEQLRPMVQRTADELLDAAAAKPVFDFIEDFAFPLPLIVVSRLLGVDVQHQAQFRDWSLRIMAAMGMTSHAPDLIAGATTAIAELTAYVRSIAERLRADPDDSLMSALVASAEAGERLSPTDLVANAVLLLIAGHETTTNLLANGLLALLAHPAQREALRRDPSRFDHAGTEVARYDTSVQLTSRVTVEDGVVGDTAVPAGSMLMLFLGAANRDPEQFANPDAFDVDRPEIKEATFGAGIHYCLGAPLARIELPVGLASVLQRFPDLRVDAPALAWRENPIYRGPKALPVRHR
jgi:cytochrome P450